ncbi:MAG: hypothetical protein DMF83_17220 [Acidobacteria bacterium]|nr:MAG: hypothetical protein DMF83_17220 [Acidobacteriota bacterium]
MLLIWRRPQWLLAGVLAAQAYAWGVTNYPLQRLYALGPSRDRIANLGLVQVVAAGGSPLQTTQVGQLHFEPFWGVLVAALSGWDPERVLRLYPVLPLVMAVGFPLALYLGLRPLDKNADGWSAWERVLVAGFAALLSSSALDYAGAYRVPWARSFLLKPNHALGLVIFPLFLGLFARIRSWRGRLVAGLVLHLLGWVFILHMAYVGCGLLFFALLSWLEDRGKAQRDLLDVTAVLAINLLVVSPYLVMLLVGYPFLVRHPNYALPAGSPHLLEGTLAAGGLFWLGGWGAVVAYRRGDRLGRLWTAQVLGGFAVWLAYLGLGAIHLARERDEIFYWLRFLIAASAGIGAWDLVKRVTPLTTPRLVAPAQRAAAVALVAVPFSLPYWWDPARMDPNFAGSLTPLPETLRASMEFLRRETDPQAVLAGDPILTRWAAALGARRAVIADGMNATKDWEQRGRLMDLLVSSEDGAAVRAAAAPYRVRYLLVDPALLARHPPVTLADLERRPHLRRVHFSGDPEGDFVAIYRLD